MTNYDFSIEVVLLKRSLQRFYVHLVKNHALHEQYLWWLKVVFLILTQKTVASDWLTNKN